MAKNDNPDGAETPDWAGEKLSRSKPNCTAPRAAKQFTVHTTEIVVRSRLAIILSKDDGDGA
jgi:hypothetical protein